MNCPNCGNQVSGPGGPCPYCGIPLQAQPQAPYASSAPAESYQYQQPPMQTQQMPPSYGQPPVQAQQMPPSYGQPPMQPQQMSYPVPGQPSQPKKSRVGLIVGLTVGGVCLIAAFIIGGILIAGSILTPPEPSTVVIEPPVQIDPPSQPGSTTPASNTQLYTHDLIGISFELVDGWLVELSDEYPDEVLGIHTPSWSQTYVWIDRYPNVDTTYYMSDQDIMLGVYTNGLSGSVTNIKVEEDIKLNGFSWHHVEFTLSSSNSDSHIDYYLTDMPNNRGVFMYAIISPLNSPSQTDFPGYDDAYAMFDSLRFIK